MQVKIFIKAARRAAFLFASYIFQVVLIVKQELVIDFKFGIIWRNYEKFNCKLSFDRILSNVGFSYFSLFGC
ncbi:MAG: hypothetical protein ABI891_01200, partial [Acidobacteriota bacterium]